MASASATPSGEESSRADQSPPQGAAPLGDGPGEPPAGEERYGPLAVLRTRKDDGRSLILYSRAEGAQADGETPPADSPEPEPEPAA